MSLFWPILVLILYLAVIAYLGYRGYRETKNSTDYMLGGRNVHPFVMAMSYGATFISTSAIVGFGGLASLFGMSLLWLTVFNIGVGIFVAFVFIGKRTRRMGLNLDAHTFPELLARRTGSNFIQWFSGLVIFLFMPLYAAAVLIGASRVLEGLMGIPYIYAVGIFSVLVAAYVIMGGLKGVMYTDALQGSLMFFGMLVLLIVVYAKLGGIGSAHAALTNLSQMVPAGLQKIGHHGWTSGPNFGTPLWWIVYSSIVMGVGIGVLAQPQLVVRYMTVKSDQELNRAVLIGGIFILVTVGTPFIVGALSNVYFFNETGKIAIQVAGGNADKVIPMIIKQIMPKWFGYLFLLVILSAGMSTLSSQFHAIGTSIGRDFWQHGIAKGKGKVSEVMVTRVGIVLSLIFTIFLAYKFNGQIIARATAIFFGLMASSLLAPYIASLYWKRLTKPGAVAGMLSGFTVTVLMFLFVHQKEAVAIGLCQVLFGLKSLIPGMWTVVDPMTIALPVSIIFTVVVSLLTKVEDNKIIEKSFEGIK